jgi:hypothetical protein
MYDKDVYLKQFNANYYGETKQAKELEKYVKDGFQGGVYIPWAVMQRLLKQQDPDFEFDIHENENGGTVFWDTGANVTKEPYYSKSASADGTMENVDVELTSIQWNNYFVKVSCTFFGKTETEYYPIQGQVGKVFNGAPKIIDQNMVNKAIQRAKAKIGSMVSGLAYKLYEDGDLQFEPDESEKPKKTIVPSVAVSAPTPEPEKTEKGVEPAEKIMEKGTEPLEQTNSVVFDYAKYLVDNKTEVIPILQKMNVAVAKTYGFTFDLDEPIEEVASKLDKVSNSLVFFKAILTQIGKKPDEISKILGGK